MVALPYAVKRNQNTDAYLLSTMLPRQWGYSSSTDRLIVLDDNGVTPHYFGSETLYSSTTVANSGARKIGLETITGLSATTVYAALVELANEQNFLSLSDTPSSYAGAGDYFVKVNVAENALVFEPLASLASTYGTVYLDSPAANALAANSTWYTLNSVDTVGVYNNVTLSVSPDKITIEETGPYIIQYSISAESDTATDLQFKVKVNGSTFLQETGTKFSILNAGDTNSATGLAIVDLTAGDELELQGEYSTGSSISVTIQYCSFNVVMLGSGVSIGAGATTFVSLTDTPASFAGSGDYIVTVNSGANALVFTQTLGLVQGGTNNNWSGHTEVTEFLIQNGTAIVPSGYSSASFSAPGHTHTHNSTTSIQGGTSGEYYHLTSAHHSGLTSGGNTTLHTHSIYMDLTTTQSITNYGAVKRFYSNTDIATAAGSLSSLEVFQPTAGEDAFMAFHVSDDFAAYFGLDGGINDFAVGGWSMLGNRYRVAHANNLSNFPIVMNDASGTSNLYLLPSLNGDLHTVNVPGITSAETVASNTNGPTGADFSGHFWQITDASGNDVKHRWAFNNAGNNLYTELQWGAGTHRGWKQIWTSANIVPPANGGTGYDNSGATTDGHFAVFAPGDIIVDSGYSSADFASFSHTHSVSAISGIPVDNARIPFGNGTVLTNSSLFTWDGTYLIAGGLQFKVSGAPRITGNSAQIILSEVVDINYFGGSYFRAFETGSSNYIQHDASGLTVSNGITNLNGSIISGYGGAAGGNYAQFSHNSRYGGSNYSFLSSNDGDTLVNSSSGYIVHIRENNSSMAQFQGGALRMVPATHSPGSWTGASMELFTTTEPRSYVQAYNRSTASYVPLEILGGTVNIQSFGTVALALNSGTVFLTAQPSGSYGGTSNPPNFLGQQMSDNDYWKIYGEGTSNAGALVFETGDDGTEPFIFRGRAAGTAYDAMVVRTAIGRSAVYNNLGIEVRAEGNTPPGIGLHRVGASAVSIYESGSQLYILPHGGSGGVAWHSGNDGPGSGLDADYLDGYEGSSYIRPVLTGYALNSNEDASSILPDAQYSQLLIDLPSGDRTLTLDGSFASLGAEAIIYNAHSSNTLTVVYVGGSTTISAQGNYKRFFKTQQDWKIQF